jgi:hypothetical protein
MSERRGDPHEIEAELEALEEYQAPPREHEAKAEADQPSAAEEGHVDLSLLEAQQGRHKPEMSETKRTPSITPGIDISGKDELGDPARPDQPPPGERM